MYIDFYGRKLKNQPSEGFLQKNKKGIWVLEDPKLPVDDLKTKLEDINIKFLQNLFSDPSVFWSIIENLKFDLTHAGLDPEARANKDQFNKFLNSASSDVKKLYFTIQLGDTITFPKIYLIIYPLVSGMLMIFCRERI